MKKKVLIIVLLITVIVGGFSCYMIVKNYKDKVETNDSQLVEKENKDNQLEEQANKIEVNNEKLEGNEENKESSIVLDEPKIDDKKIETNSSNEQSKEEVKKEDSSVPKSNEKKNVDTPSTQSNTSPKQEPKQEQKQEPKVWEELGISEYDYYNSPMMSWQKVTHSTFDECRADGDKITSDPSSGYTDYWCYGVNSYSGRNLGVMLRLS